MSIENRKNQEEEFTVQEKINNRQELTYALDLKGYSNSEIASKLSVSESTVEKDLRFVRNDWNMRYLQLEKSGYIQAFLDAKEHMTMVIQELWQLFKNEDNSKIKVSILTSISQIAFNRKELMQTKLDYYADILKISGVYDLYEKPPL